MATAGEEYDKIYDRHRGRRWMNLGYSDATAEDLFKTENYAQVCENLATELAEGAKLESGDVVVDVGCGYGIQDVHFLKQTPGIEITAVNISDQQIEGAKEDLAQYPEEIRNSITYVTGDAADLPIEDSFADKLISLESTAHFRTRDRFFAEAWRVLKPGGTLAIADIIGDASPVKPAIKGVWNSPLIRMMRGVCRIFQVGKEMDICPAENQFSKEVFVQKLEALGFEGVSVRDLSPNIALWPNQRYSDMVKWWNMVPRPWQHRSTQTQHLIPTFANHSLDYLLICAKKPEA